MGQEWRSLSEAEISERDPDAEAPFGTFAPNALQAALIAAARGSFLKRGEFRGRLFHLVMWLRAGPLDIRFRGGAFRIRGESNLIEHALLLNPDYNAEDLDFLIQDAPGDAGFIDIGSNLGLYTQSLALATKGRVLAIDANPKMISRLSWNIAATGLANVRCVHAAVSDQEGTADLKIRKDDEAIVAIEEIGNGHVRVRTLSTLVAEAGLTAIHGLKIDIEGHEDKALVPFLDSAPKSLLPRRLVIEHPAPDRDYPGCTEAFARHGYVLVGRTRNNSLYRLE